MTKDEKIQKILDVAEFGVFIILPNENIEMFKLSVRRLGEMTLQEYDESDLDLLINNLD